MKSCKGKDGNGQGGNKRKSRSSPGLVPQKAVGLAQKLAEADPKMLSSPQPVRRMLHQQQDAVMVKSQSADIQAVISEADEPTSIG